MKFKPIYLILMLLPLAITLIALQYLPDQVPAHYDINGLVDRWGSKYETLITPLITIAMGVFFLWFTPFMEKKGASSKSNQKSMYITGIVTLVLFDVMTFYFLYLNFAKVTDINSTSVDMYQILFGIMGIFNIVFGLLMPKFSLNSAMGLRTKWSMKNEKTWELSQKFAGKSFIFAGILFIVASIFTRGMTCIVICLITIFIVAIIDVYYSYLISKRY